MASVTVQHVDVVIAGAAEILTCAADATDLIGATTGGVAIDRGTIVAVGDVSGYAARTTIDASGCVVMPGFVDAHTHVVFGGTRAAEYGARVAGAAPPPGAAVGIAGTVAQTRGLAVAELVDSAGARLGEMLAHGTTTAESKTGYGLAPDAEMRLLQANLALAQAMPVTVVSTYLGAHAIPPGVPPGAYVDQVVEQVAEVGAGRLAQYCDAYCDEGYFDLAQTERILSAGREAGLLPRLHLDAYSHTGAASLAADLRAASADHLNYTTDPELARLGAAGVVGVYLPCLEYAVAHPQPLDPRRVLDAGMELALATDICPGCWAVSMQLAVQMACRAGGLTVAQALRAATYGSARSLGRAGSVGSLVPGMRADIAILDVPSHQDIAYRLGRNSVATVLKDGVAVVDRTHPGAAPGRPRQQRREGAEATA